MSESKEVGEGKHSGASNLELETDPDYCLNVMEITFGGDSALCPVEDPLSFDVEFEALRPLANASWEIKVSV